jgi:hypothetical protein
VPATAGALAEKQSTVMLFFLTQNPDNHTYSHMGARFILTLQNGEYSYRIPAMDFANEIARRLEFSPSMDEAFVDQAVKDTVSRSQ